MKKYRLFILFFLALFVLQFSFLPLISIYGIVPDLLLLATVSFSFLRGSVWGAFVGFALGMVQDLSTGSFFGLNAFLMTLVGLFFRSCASGTVPVPLDSFHCCDCSEVFRLGTDHILAWLPFQFVFAHGPHLLCFAFIPGDLRLSDSLGNVSD